AGVCARCHVAQVLEWSVAAKHGRAGTNCAACHGAGCTGSLGWHGGCGGGEMGEGRAGAFDADGDFAGEVGLGDQGELEGGSLAEVDSTLRG
ncbi:MAG: hypothetical protein ACK6D7_22420, partial [Acidobacteriota bacterium]